MLNFNSVMVGTDNPKRLIEFYTKVFGKDPDMADETYSGWSVGSAFLSIGPHSEIDGPAKEPQRILLDFETSDVKGEFNRIKALGAQVIKEAYEPGPGYWVATFADPDGNYFQLVSPWDQDNK